MVHHKSGVDVSNLFTLIFRRYEEQIHAWSVKKGRYVWEWQPLAPNITKINF